MESLLQCDVAVMDEYNGLKREMQVYMDQKAQGALLRSRTKFYQEGECSSKYYFSLEKQHSAKKLMRQIKNCDGIKISDQKLILKEQAKYFKKLYNSNLEVSFQLQNDTDIKITDQTKTQLEEGITLTEMAVAVYQMPNDKAPGVDGLSIEV